MGVRAEAIAAVLGGMLALAGTASSSAPVQGFVENHGQFESSVLFFGVEAGLAVRFEADGPVLEVSLPSDGLDGAPEAAAGAPRRARETRRIEAGRRLSVAIGFDGGGAPVSIDGEGLLPGRYRFLLGRDPAAWRSDVPAWERVVYRGVRPGVDVVFRFADGGLAYEVVADRDAGLHAAALTFDGSGSIVDEGGVLRIAGARAESATAARAIDADPMLGTDLRFSTFLGGIRDEAVYAVALDAQARPIVAGATRSAAFPATAGAYDTSYAVSFDAFVTQLDADGATVLWSTFLGGSGDDRVWAIRLDGAGRPVVAGVTGSVDFPIAGAPFGPSFNGGSYDAFVTKLAADGSALVYSTYYGGSDGEWDVSGLVLDAAGRPWLSGSTRSTDLPTSVGTLDAQLDGPTDGFVAAFAADGTALVFGSYLGGSSDDAVEDLALDASGSPVVAGRTASDDFPTTPGAYAPLRPGPTATEDAFVAKLDPATGALAFGTYLGAEGTDQAFALALDASGRPIVAGMTESSFFPATAGGFQPGYAGLRDGFVAALSADGSALAWATYFGGGAGDRALDLALDVWGRPLITGWTCSEDFPLRWNPYDLSFNGPCEAYAARLHEDGSYLEYSSFVGGWRDDSGYALALDGWERPVVGGEAFSSDFPSTAGAYDPTHNSPDSNYDAFVFGLLPPTFCVEFSGAGPEVAVGKAARGRCPASLPLGGTVQVIEGALDSLSPASLGVVRALVCDATGTILDTDTVPAPGRGLFLLARFTPGGSYADGGGTSLAGARVPLAGDCP